MTTSTKPRCQVRSISGRQCWLDDGHTAPHGYCEGSDITRLGEQLDAVTKERDLLQLRVDALRAVFDCTTLPGAAARLVQLLDERGHGAFDRDVEDAIGELTKMVGPLR